MSESDAITTKIRSWANYRVPRHGLHLRDNCWCITINDVTYMFPEEQSLEECESVLDAAVERLSKAALDE